MSSDRQRKKPIYKNIYNRKRHISRLLSWMQTIFKWTQSVKSTYVANYRCTSHLNIFKVSFIFVCSKDLPSNKCNIIIERFIGRCHYNCICISIH